MKAQICQALGMHVQASSITTCVLQVKVAFNAQEAVQELQRLKQISQDSTVNRTEAQYRAAGLQASSSSSLFWVYVGRTLRLACVYVPVRLCSNCYSLPLLCGCSSSAIWLAQKTVLGSVCWCAGCSSCAAAALAGAAAATA